MDDEKKRMVENLAKKWAGLPHIGGIDESAIGIVDYFEFSSLPVKQWTDMLGISPETWENYCNGRLTVASNTRLKAKTIAFRFWAMRNNIMQPALEDNDKILALHIAKALIPLLEPMSAASLIVGELAITPDGNAWLAEHDRKGQLNIKTKLDALHIAKALIPLLEPMSAAGLIVGELAITPDGNALLVENDLEYKRSLMAWSRQK
ncbi:MAG: hypothetical protein VB042_08660 [Victivallaceae bacterium]|nr:hypothetical protein [Victivallaceae bacterium]